MPEPPSRYSLMLNRYPIPMGCPGSNATTSGVSQSPAKNLASRSTDPDTTSWAGSNSSLHHPLNQTRKLLR